MKCKEFESLVESYIDGTIREKVREDFEAHYFECEKCFALLKLHENLIEKKVMFLPGKSKANTFLPRFKPAAVFSSVLFVFLVSFYFVNNRNLQKKYDSIAIFKPPVFVKAETRNSHNNYLFLQALEKYNNRSYKEALNLISGYETSSSKVTFFKGILLLLNKKPDEAIENFDKIIKNMDPSYFDQAIYYKSLSLLKLREKELAIKELSRLTNMFSPLKERAKILIKKIEDI